MKNTKGSMNNPAACVLFANQKPRQVFGAFAAHTHRACQYLSLGGAHLLEAMPTPLPCLVACAQVHAIPGLVRTTGTARAASATGVRLQGARLCCTGPGTPHEAALARINTGD